MSGIEHQVAEPVPASPRRVPPPHLWRRSSVRALGFLVPAVAVLLAIRVIPLGEAVWLSFMSWDGFSDPTFVGLDNFAAILRDPGFWAAMRNNGILLLCLPLWILGPLGLAVLLQDRVPGWRILRLAYFLPAVLSPVVVGIYFSVLLRFDGPLNGLLRSLGLDTLVRGWLTDNATALPVTIAIIIWAGFGVGVLLYMAALGNVDPVLYDAAHVDGATTWQRHWHVTLPQVLPVIEFYTVVVMVSVFTVLFPYIYTLTRGGPGYRTMVLDYYVYTAAFTDGRFGYASAVGTVLLLMLMVMVSLTMYAFRRKQ